DIVAQRGLGTGIGAAGMRADPGRGAVNGDPGAGDVEWLRGHSRKRRGGEEAGENELAHIGCFPMTKGWRQTSLLYCPALIPSSRRVLFVPPPPCGGGLSHVGKWHNSLHRHSR